MERELPEARIEPDIVAVGIVHPRLEVVDDPPAGGAAEVLERAPVRHRPVAHRLVGRCLRVDQVRMCEHGDEDLHVGLAAPGAKGQRLARRSPPSRTARARSRSASAPSCRSCPGAPSGARNTGCSCTPCRPGPRPRRGTPPKACGASRAPGAASAWLQAHGAQPPSPAAHTRSLAPPADTDARAARHRRDRTATAMTDPPPARAPERSIPSPRSRSRPPRSPPGASPGRDGAEGCPGCSWCRSSSLGPCLLESISGSMRLSRERIGAPENMDVDGARRAIGTGLRPGLRRSSAAGIAVKCRQNFGQIKSELRSNAVRFCRRDHRLCRCCREAP